MYYNKDGIRTELNKDLIRYNALLEAWDKVTFLTKKDGSPFKNMKQNIKGASYKPIEHAIQAGQYRLTVYTVTKETGYIDDYIDCYDYVIDLKDPEKIAKTKNHLPQTTKWLKQVYKYDIEDIKKAVEIHKIQLKERIKETQENIKNLENAYNAFREGYKNLMSKLIENTNNNATLKHAITETITKHYPHC